MKQKKFIKTLGGIATLSLILLFTLLIRWSSSPTSVKYHNPRCAACAADRAGYDTFGVECDSVEVEVE